MLQILQQSHNVERNNTRLSRYRHSFMIQYLTHYLKRPEVRAKRKEHNQSQSYKIWKKQWSKEYESRQDVKKRKKQLNMRYDIRERIRVTHRQYQRTKKYQKYLKTEKVRYRIKIKNERYYTDNPEVYLKSHKKQLTRLGKLFNFSLMEVRYALSDWSRVIKKNHNDCVVCGSKEKLEAHHILLKSKYPKLALNVNNGVTLCKEHHYEVHGFLMGGV